MLTTIKGYRPSGLQLNFRRQHYEHKKRKRKKRLLDGLGIMVGKIVSEILLVLSVLVNVFLEMLKFYSLME
jgi:hypothetical protein